MAGVCTACRDPAKVLLFGECQYESCAHQYYLNTTTRVCRGKSQNSCAALLLSNHVMIIITSDVVILNYVHVALLMFY